MFGGQELAMFSSRTQDIHAAVATGDDHGAWALPFLSQFVPCLARTGRGFPPVSLNEITWSGLTRCGSSRSLRTLISFTQQTPKIREIYDRWP